ncbi:MAG: hypothetical protein GY696_02260 [Gammaproteobacteria bacterium]|nr:hypothetical protein [Gammaproteobacteria bacterium]
MLLRRDGRRTDPYMHTKQDGYENKRKECTPPHLSPKHKGNVQKSTKTNSEHLSVTAKASESQSKKKEDWTAEKGSNDNLRKEMDKRKKDREGGNRKDEGKGRDTEARASTPKETRTIRERHSSVENKSSERPQADEAGPLRRRTLLRTPDRVHSKGRREEESRKPQPMQVACLTGGPLRMETEMEKGLDTELSGLVLKTTEAQQRGIEVGRDPERDPVRTQ